MSKNSKIMYFFTSMLLFILFDMLLSNFIVNSVYDLEQNILFRFVLIQNTGAAFNLLEGARIFLITFSIFAVILIIIYVMKHIKRISLFTLFFSAMLIAGILNNACERLIFGYVRDYIELKFIDFPVFNISDIFINIAVFGIVYIVIKNHYMKNHENNS